jgi:hypothetical protein
VIKFVAMCGKANGANEWDDIGGDGIVLRVTESSAAKGGGEIKDGKVERGEGSREGGEVLIEGLVESGELGNKGGVPRVERREVVYGRIVENIGSEIIGDGGLGARAEELAFSL